MLHFWWWWWWRCVCVGGRGGGAETCRKVLPDHPKNQQHPLSHKNEPSLSYCLTRTTNPHFTDRLTSARQQHYVNDNFTRLRRWNGSTTTTTSCDYDDETEHRYDEIQKEMCNKKVWRSAKLSFFSLKPGVFLYSILDLLIIDVTKFPHRTSLSFTLFGKKYKLKPGKPFIHNFWQKKWDRALTQLTWFVDLCF